MKVAINLSFPPILPVSTIHILYEVKLSYLTVIGNIQWCRLFLNISYWQLNPERSFVPCMNASTCPTENIIIFYWLLESSDGATKIIGPEFGEAYFLKVEPFLF